MNLKYILFSVLILTGNIYAQSFNFRMGDKWIYSKKEIINGDTVTSYLKKEIYEIYPGAYVRVSVNKYSLNEYWAEEWSITNNRIGMYIFNQSTRVYDSSKADFKTGDADNYQFMNTGSDTLFDSIPVIYQHWGDFNPIDPDVETKYSPEVGLFYFYYFFKDDPNSGAYFLEAASIGCKPYGQSDLFNLWKTMEFPEHRVFKKGDKWIYQKEQITGDKKKTSYIVKELIDETGTLAVKEFPGNSSWQEKWVTTPDKASIFLTSNTVKEPGELILYDTASIEFHRKDIQTEELLFNKTGQFLQKEIKFQHRLYYNRGYWRAPAPRKMETMYSPELGLLYMYHLSTGENQVYFNDSYTLKAIQAGAEIIGDSGFFSFIEQKFHIGDKWVYEKKRTVNGNAASSYVIKEVVSICNDTIYFRANDYPNNIYWDEYWIHNKENVNVANAFGFDTKFVHSDKIHFTVYDDKESDYNNVINNNGSFLYNQHDTVLGKSTKAQYRGYYYGGSYFIHAHFEIRYSPDAGIYQFYFEDYNDNSKTSYDLKAMSLFGISSGDKSLLELWGTSSMPPAQTFRKGDKWIYYKEHKEYPDTTGSYIIKEVSEVSASDILTLNVRELPGDKTWKEYLNITQDKVSITLDTNAIQTTRNLELYNTQSEDLYNYSQSWIGISITFINNKTDEFLGKKINYQHRLIYESYVSRVKVAEQTSSIFSPELGILFYSYFNPQIFSYYDDNYILKAAQVSDIVYGNKDLLDHPEKYLIDPENLLLMQNYPNPFNSSTTIKYNIPVKASVTLKVYNTLGELVRILVNEEKLPGVYFEKFNSAQLSSGVYLYTLQSGSNAITKKLLLIK